MTNDVAGTVMIVTTGSTSGASSTTSQSQTSVPSTSAASAASSTGSSSSLPVSYLGVLAADAAVILLVAMLLGRARPRRLRFR